MWVVESKSKHVLSLLAVVAAGWFVVSARAATLLSTDFETNPLTQGWTTSGTGIATWTTNQSFSATHSIAGSNEVSWLTPLLNTTPLQWHRLSFKSRAPGAVGNAGSIGYCYWAAEFYDTNGVKLNDDQYSSVFQSAGWVTNEFRIRAKHTAGTNATLVPARMQLRFQAFTAPLFIDDVLIETVSPEEAAQWGDTYYDRIPAKLCYVPKSNHGSRLPLTLNRLRTAQKLRIVMLGDSVQQDTANAPIDAWLQRLYPGATIELISSTRGGTGVQYYKDHVAAFILAYQPDLLCIGGISHDDNMANFQSVVNQVRADDLARGRTTEILILTKQWSPNNNFGNYFLAPGLTELDQVAANNPGGVPNDYRGHLLTFCASNNIEYLDLTGVAAQFIYGPATAGGVGPPANANGDPYSYWMRDFIHANDNGKMILGRMLEAFFAPTPRLSIERTGNSARLAWPLAATGYHLQTTPLLATNPAWISNATTFAVTNGKNVLTTNLPAATNQLFFRLRKP
jgi:hypothetical protein